MCLALGLSATILAPKTMRYALKTPGFGKFILKKQKVDLVRPVDKTKYIHRLGLLSCRKLCLAVKEH